MNLAKLADHLPQWAREKIARAAAKKFLRKAGVKEEDVDKILGLLGGWKSKAGGLIGIGTGLAMIGHSLTGTFSFDEITKGFAAVAAGLSVIGIGHKMEKQTAATLVASSDPVISGAAQDALAKEVK